MAMPATTLFRRGLILATVVALLAWGRSGITPLSAAGVPSPNLSIGIDLDGDAVPDCTTGRSPPADTCELSPGQEFTVQARLDGIAGLPDVDGDGVAGYLAVQVRLVSSAGLPYRDRPGQEEWGLSTSPYWPACSFRAESTTLVTEYLTGCTTDSLSESTYTGLVMEVDYACPPGPSTHTVKLAHGTPMGSHVLGEAIKPVLDQNDKGALEVLTVNCGFPWDVNSDGIVSIGDIGAVVSAFGQTVPPAPPEVDVDGDGIVSVGDIGQVVVHFGETAPP